MNDALGVVQIQSPEGNPDGSRLARVLPRRSVYWVGGTTLRLLSCFADEAGQQDMRAGYYMLTLVFHDQTDNIAPLLDAYASRLTLEGLPDIPYHGVDLIHGHERYESESVETRKRLLVAFSMLVRTLPIAYKTFTFDAGEVPGKDALQARMRRDVVNFIFEHLEWFHGYDHVPLYYDGGHGVVSTALRGAFDYALARSVVVYKDVSHEAKRLAQAADYLCSIELAEIRYRQGKVSASYERFYGNPRNFKQNYLKQARRKRIG